MHERRLLLPLSFIYGILYAENEIMDKNIKWDIVYLLKTTKHQLVCSQLSESSAGAVNGQVSCTAVQNLSKPV